MEAHLRLTTSAPQTASSLNPHEPLPCISFGTGSQVRLPGPSATQPNVFAFNGTSYAAMHAQLASQDERLYTHNGILTMLERNKGVKWGPERWQDWRVGVPRVGRRPWSQGVTSSAVTDTGEGKGEPTEDFSTDRGAEGTEAGVVDVVITCEERCWDAVVDDLLSRGSPLNRPVHVFNIDIKDNHEEALVAGGAIVELADALQKAASEERGEWLMKSGGPVGGEGEDAFAKGEAGARGSFDERVPDVLAEWQERWPGLPALWTLAWF